MSDVENEALLEPTYRGKRDDRSSDEETKKATIPKDRFLLNGFLNAYVYVLDMYMSGSRRGLFRFKLNRQPV